MKLCGSCDYEKEEEEFYITASGALFSRCKQCVCEANKAKRVKKPTGFAALDEEVQEGIIEMLKDRRNKIADVARRYKIHYGSLAGWFREGRIPV